MVYRENPKGGLKEEPLSSYKKHGNLSNGKIPVLGFSPEWGSGIYSSSSVLPVNSF